MPIVYQAVNSMNGKKYIGVSKNALKIRTSQHFCAAAKGSPMVFAKAIRKYGKEAFVFSVLHEVDDYREALRLERKLIAEHRPEYNTAAGGIGPMDVKWSDERRAKIIPALRRSWTEERKEKASKAQKATWSEERKLAASKLAKSRPAKMKRPIVCLSEGRWFEGIKAASLAYGIGHRNITAVCNGEYFQAGGLRFADCPFPPSEDELRILLEDNLERERISRLNRNSDKRRAVIRIADGVLFGSISEAAKMAGLSQSRIQQMCNGIGFGFKYADAICDPIPIRATTEQLVAAKKKRLEALTLGVETNKKKVLCLDSGEVFSSISEAARTYNVHVSALSAAIYRNGKASGLRFQFMERAA